jgi:hypothetical protein
VEEDSVSLSGAATETNSVDAIEPRPAAAQIESENTVTLAFVVDALPPKPTVGSNKPKPFKGKGQVSIPASIKMQKKQKALLDEANKRIIAAEAAATDLTAFATGVVQSSKNSIDSLYKSTQGFHKKYGAGIEQEAKQATKYNELLRENKTVTDELKKAKKEISQLKSKIEGMKDKKAQMLLEIKDLKSKNKSSRSSAAHAKSPGTIAKEKHELKMIEMKKRAEVKQQMKERDREHDNDVRNERVNMMSRFSLDSMRGDGKFVSIIVCSLFHGESLSILVAPSTDSTWESVIN